MADDDLSILSGKSFCPNCGTQLQVPGDEEDEHYCNSCGWSGDPASVTAAAGGADPDDDDDDDDLDPNGGLGFPDEPSTSRSFDSGPSYADYVRNARGKSVDDLFADAAARVKPPKPLKTATDLEEALGTASAAALSTAGVCPSCGAEPDKIINGTCSECGTTQAQGFAAWVVADPEGKTHGACSELCGKVGAAQVDGGKLIGKRPWTPPADTDEPECFVCGEKLTAVEPSAAPAPAAAPQGPGGQPFVIPGGGPGGTTVVGNVAGRTPGDPAPYKVGDRVRSSRRFEDRPDKNMTREEFDAWIREHHTGTVASIDTDHLDLLGKELGRSTAVDMDNGTRGVAAIDKWELIPDDEEVTDE